MVKVFSIEGITPVIHPSAFVHPRAVLIGDVIVGPNCYVGPCAVLRGDFGRLVMEEGANLQDCCVVHGFPGTDTVIEQDGHIGHGAVLHGCRVGRNALVGMNAVLMDGVVVGESSIVASMAFVKAGFVVPPRSLAVGSPAKVLRTLEDKEISWKSQGTREYQELTRRSLASMQEVEALNEVEPDRRRIEAGSVAPLYKTKEQGGE